MKTKQDLHEEEILKQYNNLIMKLSFACYRNYHGKYNLEDLTQEARLGALRAIRIFDPSKNVKMITHIHNYINFYLSHYIRKDTGLIKIPRTAITENKKLPEFIDNEIFQNNFVNEQCAEDIDLEEKIEKEMIFDEFLSILSDKEKDILRLAFIDGYTYAEIAEKYKVSRQYANTTANKALAKIKDKFFCES